MSAHEETIHAPLPEDASIVTGRLVVMAYVRDDGSSGYGDKAREGGT